MSDTKFCPNCNGEVIASAHKCKHCGTWIDKKCPICGEWILAEAKKCKHCGTWLDKPIEDRTERVTQADEISKIKESIAEAKEADDAGCIMYIESMIVAGAVSYYTNWVGVLVCLIILGILLQIRAVRFLYCILVSGLWGLVGYAFGDVSGGIIVFVISIALHAPAMKKGFDL